LGLERLRTWEKEHKGLPKFYLREQKHYLATVLSFNKQQENIHQITTEQMENINTMWNIAWQSIRAYLMKENMEAMSTHRRPHLSRYFSTHANI